MKLYSAVPHSMADERTMSVVTMVNSALPNHQKVETIMAMTQIRSYYCGPAKVRTYYFPAWFYLTFAKPRASTRQHPTVKFANITCILRLIDEPVEDDFSRDVSDSKESDNKTLLGPREEVEPSDSFAMMYADSELDFDAVSLMSVLADKVTPEAKEDIPLPSGMLIGEDSGTFELGEWV